MLDDIHERCRELNERCNAAIARSMALSEELARTREERTIAAEANSKLIALVIGGMESKEATPVAKPKRKRKKSATPVEVKPVAPPIKMELAGQRSVIVSPPGMVTASIGGALFAKPVYGPVGLAKALGELEGKVDSVEIFGAILNRWRS